MDLPDDELVAGFMSGNDLCFAELVRRHQRPLLWFLTEITNDAALAEDAAQETLMVASTSIGTLENPARFRNWMFGIARNQGLRQVRQAQRGPVTLSLSADPDLAPSRDSRSSLRHEDSRAERLQRILADLDGDDRALLHLIHVDGYTSEDVAEISGQKPATIRKRKSRLRKEIRIRLDEPEEKTA
jgi:RNA polymerase sigma-70 factor, ECF subfamily